ncbi:MAG: hypothetical protein ACPIOQ_11490, partial [Promethearchaeia archaeon]
ACKGHSGRILSMDWSRDGLHMQSTSDQYEHLFWRVEDAHSARLRYKLQRPSTCCDVDWSEWTSSLGWWVRGFRNIAKDETSILSTYSPGLYTSSLCVAWSSDSNDIPVLRRVATSRQGAHSVWSCYGCPHESRRR